MTAQSFAALQVSKAKNKVLLENLFLIGGVAFVALMAQVAIPLPWTPVPITGQTFAVALLPLLFGAGRGVSVMSVYLALGWMGVPLFAMGRSGFLLGPTFGYLIGMLLATLVVGLLADKGLTKSFYRAFAASCLGSVVVLSCGVFGLSFFVPTESLLVMGILPYLFGEVLKNMAAAAIGSR